MFQNVISDFGKNQNQAKEVKFSSDEISDIVKKFFSKRNIIIYVISFMISMISFGGDVTLGLAPFGFAILAASASSGIPISIVYIVTLIGSYIGLGKDLTFSYFLTSLVFFVSLIIVKTKKQYDVNEKIKLGKNVVLSILAVNIVPMIFTSFNFSQIIFSLILSCIAFIFYKIFTNAIGVIYEYGEKSVFSIEELMGASLLLSIAITALGPISFFGYSLKNIICIFIVLVLGWKSGVLIGTTGGVTIGIVLGIIGNESPIIVAAYAIAGLLAGIFNKIGKIGVIIGFIAGNVVITYVSDGNIEPIIVFQEILIASLGLILLPKNIEVFVNEIFETTEILPDIGNKALNESKETVKKLNDMSETISEIAKSYDEVVTKNEEIDEDIVAENKKYFKEELKKILLGKEENILYDDIFNSDNLFNEIFEQLTREHEITRELIITLFAKYEKYIIGAEENDFVENDLEDMVKSINKAFDVSKINFVWKKKLKEKDKNVSIQLQGVSDAINDLAEDIKGDKEEIYIEKKELITKLLLQKEISVVGLKIKESESKRKIINIYTKFEEDSYVENGKKIEKILSKVFEEEISLQKYKKMTKENVCIYRFMSNDKFNLKIGIARAKKHDSPVSGDTCLQTKLNDGKYLLAISDGMGSGPEARKSSKIAIKMLEKMLSSGFKKDVSLKMINSTLNANDDDMYATLDVLILDLFDGNMELIKNGACPTYIKRHKEVELINTIALPTGIVENIDLSALEKDIQDGDIIVMCSDGIIESQEEFLHKELWLKYFLEEIKTDDVQEIADIIISEAIDNDYGKEKDDMTVIVAKISK